ncbi:hypothetical protein E3P78_03822 [Wallemia ichthyophaga]|nr:hypothetical protein E3P78_03822 [Wallemia ichthyophaga]
MSEAILRRDESGVSSGSSSDGSDGSSDVSNSSDDDNNDDNNSHLSHLLNSARTNLSNTNNDHLNLNDDLVKLDDAAQESKQPIPTLTSSYNLNTLPPLKPSQRKSDNFKQTVPKKREMEISAIEKQTENALNGASAAMSSRPAHDAGTKPSRRQLKESKESTAGKDWFDLPAPPSALLPQWRREAEALQLRNSLDPKRFYKGGKQKLPKHFAIGRILPGRNAGDSLADGAEDAKARRNAKGFINEALEDKDGQRYAKRKYNELQAERGQEYGQRKKAKETLKRMDRTRSRLQIVKRPQFIAESYSFDDESKATTGVDSAEAEETHLQNAINASQKRNARSKPSHDTTQSASNNDKADSVDENALSTPQDDSLGIIPTPDATGRVTNYYQLYKPNQYPDAWSYIKYSDTIEEAQLGGLVYTIDERDYKFIQEHNKAVKGEGTSTDASSKDEKKNNDILIDDNLFELVMSVFEKVTDDIAPTLHTDLSRIPDFSEFQLHLKKHDLLDNFPNVAPLKLTITPDNLVKLGQIIYQHWRARRVRRQGKPIHPQLNYDESNDGDPYVCFRRREVKPVRKTRRADLQSVEKMEKLHKELIAAQQLVVSVIDREKKKAEAVDMDKSISQLRHTFRTVKRKLGVVGPDDGKADDELLSGHKPKRIKVETKLPNKRNNASPSVNTNNDKASVPIATLIEKHILAKREADQMWEDFTESSLIPNHFPGSKFYRALPNDIDDDGEMGRRTFRLRIGRGGRRILDRRHPFIDYGDDDSSNLDDDERKLRELQKYDADVVYTKNAKGLGPTFGDKGENLLIDDYDERFMRHRASLLTEDDINNLTAPTSHVDAAMQAALAPPPPLPNYTIVRPNPNNKAQQLQRNNSNASNAQNNGKPQVAQHLIRKASQQNAQSTPLQKSNSAMNGTGASKQPAQSTQSTQSTPKPPTPQMNGNASLPPNNPTYNAIQQLLAQQQQQQQHQHQQPQQPIHPLQPPSQAQMNALLQSTKTQQHLNQMRQLMASQNNNNNAPNNQLSQQQMLAALLAKQQQQQQQQQQVRQPQPNQLQQQQQANAGGLTAQQMASNPQLAAFWRQQLLAHQQAQAQAQAQAQVAANAQNQTQTPTHPTQTQANQSTNGN